MHIGEGDEFAVHPFIEVVGVEPDPLTGEYHGFRHFGSLGMQFLSVTEYSGE